MIRGLSLLVKEFDVVAPAFDERNGAGTLARRLLPGALLDRAVLEGDLRLLIGVLARAEIKFAIVVRGGPERVVARVRRMDVAADSRAIVVGPVGGTFEDRQELANPE